MSADPSILCQLEAKIDGLIAHCQSLAEQNQNLQLQKKHLSKERAQLIKCQQEARERLETLVEHLKMLEAGRWRA